MGATQIIIIQIAGTVIALVAAVAAWRIAILNYKSRPLAVRARERHSDELKEIVNQLRGAWNVLQSAETYHLDISEPVPLSFPFEGSLGFRDLQSHMPYECSLLGEWDDFKQRFLHYKRTRHELAGALVSYIGHETNLLPPSDYDRPKAGQLNSFVLDILWQELVRVAFYGDKRTSLTSEQFDTVVSAEVVDVRLGSRPWAAVRDPETAKILDQKLRAALLNFDVSLVQQMREVKRQEDELRRRGETINTHVEEVLFIPILPGDCSYVRRARV